MISLSPAERVETITAPLFLSTFKRLEQPVVIEKLTESWPACQKWHLDYIRQVAGNKLVPLYDSQPATNRKHQYAIAKTMLLRDYLTLLEQGEKNLRIFFYNILTASPELCKDFSFPDIGLHFFKRLPVLFVGGKGARVQMHFDIDLADICLCHFGGTKRVMLFPPEQTPLMYRVPFSFSSLFDVNYESPNFEKYPALKYLQGQMAELHHGDALYIPPGWWHYIMYDDISFSMALRAFPRKPKNMLQMGYNLVWIKTIEGVMRKVMGQKWNMRNERCAIEKTHHYMRRQALF